MVPQRGGREVADCEHVGADDLPDASEMLASHQGGIAVSATVEVTSEDFVVPVCSRIAFAPGPSRPGRSSRPPGELASAVLESMHGFGSLMAGPQHLLVEPCPDRSVVDRCEQSARLSNVTRHRGTDGDCDRGGRFLDVGRSRHQTAHASAGSAGPPVVSEDTERTSDTETCSQSASQPGTVPDRARPRSPDQSVDTNASPLSGSERSPNCTEI